MVADPRTAAPRTDLPWLRRRHRPEPASGPSADAVRDFLSGHSTGHRHPTSSPVPAAPPAAAPPAAAPPAAAGAGAAALSGAAFARATAFGTSTAFTGAPSADFAGDGPPAPFSLAALCFSSASRFAASA